MNVIKSIYIFNTELTTAIEIFIGSTSNTVFSSKNDDKPNIPSSIDTLNEQKTNKKLKDKTRKKKKKKDEEQDNPADVQDNDVLT
jgi:hypothetical protein